MDVARDMLAVAARASDTPFEENSSQFANIPAVPFRLPDGTEVRRGSPYPAERVSRGVGGAPSTGEAWQPSPPAVRQNPCPWH